MYSKCALIFSALSWVLKTLTLVKMYVLSGHIIRKCVYMT